MLARRLLGAPKIDFYDWMTSSDHLTVRLSGQTEVYFRFTRTESMTTAAGQILPNPASRGLSSSRSIHLEPTPAGRGQIR